jgi:hypothetical protein
VLVVWTHGLKVTAAPALPPTDNAAVFASAVGTVMRDQNVLALSEETGLRGETFSGCLPGPEIPPLETR